MTPGRYDACFKSSTKQVENNHILNRLRWCLSLIYSARRRLLAALHVCLLLFVCPRGPLPWFRFWFSAFNTRASKWRQSFPGVFVKCGYWRLLPARARLGDNNRFMGARAATPLRASRHYKHTSAILLSTRLIVRLDWSWWEQRSWMRLIHVYRTFVNTGEGTPRALRSGAEACEAFKCRRKYQQWGRTPFEHRDRRKEAGQISTLLPVYVNFLTDKSDLVPDFLSLFFFFSFFWF